MIKFLPSYTESEKGLSAAGVNFPENAKYMNERKGLRGNAFVFFDGIRF